MLNNIVFSFAMVSAASAMTVLHTNIWQWAHEHVQSMPKQTLLQIALWTIFVLNVLHERRILETWIHFYHFKRTLQFISFLANECSNIIEQKMKSFFYAGSRYSTVMSVKVKENPESYRHGRRKRVKEKRKKSDLSFCPSFAQSCRVQHTACRTPLAKHEFFSQSVVTLLVIVHVVWTIEIRKHEIFNRNETDVAQSSFKFWHE